MHVTLGPDMERRVVVITTAAGKAATQAPKSNGGTTAFVNDLEHATTAKQLRRHLNQAGSVEHVEVLTSKKGEPIGCARVRFATKAQLHSACTSLDGSTLLGRVIRVRKDNK